MGKAIIFGIAASFFFAFTFVLNHVMEMSGGSWLWSASLRYELMLPCLLLIVLVRRNVKPLLVSMKQYPAQWMLWSTVGFGLFYAPLCFAAIYAPGWLIAGSWQLTIISGTLLSPLFFHIYNDDGVEKSVRQTIPYRNLRWSVVIVLGVMLLQVSHLKSFTMSAFLGGIIPVLLATFAYPLGNRKMMDVCDGKLDVFQRVLGMTICSMPFWLLLSVIATIRTGLPSHVQLIQSTVVAVFSGVIATTLFFKATETVRKDSQRLAAVEATQSLEVIFTLVGEMVVLSLPLPNFSVIVGVLLIMFGMNMTTFASTKKTTEATAML